MGGWPYRFTSPLHDPVIGIFGFSLDSVLSPVGLAAFCGCFLLNDHRVLTRSFQCWLQSLPVFASGVALVFNFYLSPHLFGLLNSVVLPGLIL